MSTTQTTTTERSPRIFLLSCEYGAEVDPVLTGLRTTFLGYSFTARRVGLGSSWSIYVLGTVVEHPMAAVGEAVRAAWSAGYSRGQSDAEVGK